MIKILYTLMLVVLMFTTVLCPGKKQEGATGMDPAMEQQQPADADKGAAPAVQGGTEPATGK